MGRGGCPVTEAGLASLPVVDNLDADEHDGAELAAGYRLPVAVDVADLLLDRRPRRLDRGVVPTRPAPAERRCDMTSPTSRQQASAVTRALTNGVRSISGRRRAAADTSVVKAEDSDEVELPVTTPELAEGEPGPYHPPARWARASAFPSDQTAVVCPADDREHGSGQLGQQSVGRLQGPCTRSPALEHLSIVVGRP